MVSPMQKKCRVFSFLGLEEVDEPVESKVKEMETSFYLNNEKLLEISDKLMQEFYKGLNKDTNSVSTLKMIPTHMEHFPDGSEEGLFLGLDLGGTHFRVMIINIAISDLKKQRIKSDSQIYKIPDDIRAGECNVFFDFVVSSLVDFIDSQHLKEQKIPLCVTFSFPCKHDSLHHAQLLTWKKEFAVKNVVGKDIVKLLKEAIKRNKKVELGKVTLINDTVGTMASIGLDNKNCYGAVSIGLGSNGCYMEKISNIQTLTAKKKVKDTKSKIVEDQTNMGEMCINTEWGAFGADGILNQYRNEYDFQLDEEGDANENFPFEKMTCGLYIGELVRLVLKKMTKDGHLFRGTGSHALLRPGGITSHQVSLIENVMPSGLNAVQSELMKLDLSALSSDCVVTVRVCRAVTIRAAHLTAAGVFAMARKIKESHPEESEIVFGMDGALCKHHPTFSKTVDEKLAELCSGTGFTVQLINSREISVRGAALVAAAAERVSISGAGTST